MKQLLSELKTLLDLPFVEFKKVFTTVRTAERNFQLVIELASDINTHLIAEMKAETPDSYRESFKKMAALGILKESSLSGYIKSAGLRNILVHEYDFDEDNFIFYTSIKEFLPLYQEYLNSIQAHLVAKK